MDPKNPTAEEWRDRVFAAYPAPKYPCAFAGVVYYRGDSLIRYHEAAVFVRMAGEKIDGRPPVCALVNGCTTTDPEATFAALAEQVAALEAEWSIWDAAHPAPAPTDEKLPF